MGNIQKKQQDKLARRVLAFDQMRDKQGMKCPGSLNRKKQSAGSSTGRRR